MAIVANNTAPVYDYWSLNGAKREKSYFARQGWKQVPFERTKPRPQLDYFRCESRVRSYAIKSIAPNKPSNQIFLPSHFDSPAYTAVTSNSMDRYGKVYGDIAKLAYNKAYGRFVNAVKSDTASLGVTVAEGREALEMIARRATTLGKAYSALRRGDFLGFLKHLDTRPVPRHARTRWTRPKDASALWLEYWLGWAPMAGDIQKSIMVLTSADLFPEAFFRASARVVLPTSIYRDAGTSRYLAQDVKGFVRCSLGSSVKVKNQNTWLNNRIGLVDWLGIAWAVVPFSFVVNWFVNVDKVLASYTDFAGLELSGSWVSCHSSAKCSFDYTSWDNVATPKERYVIKVSGSEANQMRRVRVTNLPQPRVVVQLPGMSPTRAATAISLLVSLFTKG